MDKIIIGKYEISKALFLFLTITVLLGMVVAVDSTSLANRLYEDLGFTVMERSMLEAPREIPGVLSVVFIGVLNALGDSGIAAAANIIGGVGLILFGIAPNGFGMILVFLVLYSIGQHLYIPLSNTIAMTFAKGGDMGLRLGQIQGLSSLSVIISSGTLYLLYRFFEISYGTVFVISGCAMLSSGVLFILLSAQRGKVVSEKRFVLRREFKMFYVLSVINGARKQITITFAPWLLISVFEQPVTTIAALFFVVCVINIFFKPWFGKMIDRKGEVFMLKSEACVMFFACLGFTFAKSVFRPKVALAVAGFCYIADKLMESAYMARATYVKKLSKDPSHVARTLAMGQSMDHVVSVFIPVLAGYVWSVGGPGGYMYVFAGGMLISALNFIVAGKLKFRD